MSFGFSVGDFLAVINLATQIRKQFSDAPKHFKDISDEVRSLSVTLFDIAGEDDGVLHELEPIQAEHLRTILEASHHVLKDLECLLAKYGALEPGPRPQGKQRARRLWDRLTFDSAEVRDVRSRLSSNVSTLGLFLRNCSERKLGKSLKKLENGVNEDERQRVLEWVGEEPEKHVRHFQYLVRHRESNTRRWLFDSPEWHAWTCTAGKGGTLLCPGIPGAGKTYTSAMVIEHLHSILRSDCEDVGVAYFFCNYKEYDHDEVSVAKSLLGMLLRQLRHLPSTVINAHQVHRRCGTDFSDPVEVFDALKVSMRSKSRNFLVIDALDELQASARRPLISRLVELQQSTAVNLFVTSRDIGNFEDLFPGAPRITIQATDHDIQQYLSTHMRSLPLCVRKDPALQNDIKNAIAQAAGEMFLLADLHLRSLMNVRPSQKAVRAALKALTAGPSAASEAFQNAMRRINDQPKEASLMAMRTLLLLTYARRPLTVDELCHAVAVDVDEEDGEFDQHNVPEMEDVLPSCAGLVVVQSRHGAAETPATTMDVRSYFPYGPGDDSSPPEVHSVDYTKSAVVQLVHKSFQDYLSLTKGQWFPRAESVMATICRAYMSACEGIESETDHPFLDYAKSRWGYHHLKAEADSAATEMECDSNLPVRRTHSLPTEKQSLSMHFGVRQLSKELGGMQELLFWACKGGRINLVEVLLTTNLDTYTRPVGVESVQSGSPSGEFKDNDDGTYPSQQAGTRLIDYALSYSMTKDGNQAVVECLIAHGASLERRLKFPEADNYSATQCTALGHAVWEGLTNMLDFLLHHPSIDAMLADLNQIQIRSVRPREIVCVPLQIGNVTKSIRIPWILSSHAKFTWKMTPLLVAVYRDQESCLDMILDWMRSHDNGPTDETWLAACKRAMLFGLQSGSVKTLVKLSRILGVDSHFIDADSGPDREQVTTRHIGIALDSKHPLRTLLANEGVDIPQSDPHNVAAISIATSSSHTEVIQTLLSMDSIEVQPQFLVNSLFRRNTTEISLIVNKLCSGIDPQSLSRFDILSETLFCALHQQIILHDKNWTRLAYVTARFEDLQCVDTFDLIWDTSVLDSQRSCLEWDFVDVILPHTSGSDDHTAPEIALSSSEVGAGPDVAPDKEPGLGIETLFVAVALRARELVEKLVQRERLLVHRMDTKGRTALMAAVCTRSEDLTRLLLGSLDEASAASTINATSETGYSAIAYAVRARNLDQVLRLLETPGLDVWSVFHEIDGGGSPFVWALDMMGDNTISETICEALLAHPNPNRLSQATQQLQGLPRRVYLGEDRLRGCAEYSKTFLCYAVIYRRLETFKFLLETGTDIEALDGCGRTALSHAEESRLACDKSRSMVDMLLAQGADHLSLDRARRFPLWYALNSHPGPKGTYDEVDHPDEFYWEHEQLQKLYADRPRSLSEAEGIISTLFDLAVDRCASSVLDLLIQIYGSTFLLGYVDTSGLAPLSMLVLSLDIVLPTMGSEGGRLDQEISEMVSTWSGKARRCYMLLDRLQLSHDIPDKNDKTALCHALDRLYAEHCDNSHPASLLERRRSEAVTDFLLFIAEDLNDRNDSNPLMRNHEGYSPLDLAEMLRDQVNQEAARKAAQETSDAAESSLSTMVQHDPLSDTPSASSAESPSGVTKLAAETALEAFERAVRLLDTTEDEENLQSLNCSDRKDEGTSETDDNTIAGGRTRMRASIRALKMGWLRKNTTESERLRPPSGNERVPKGDET